MNIRDINLTPTIESDLHHFYVMLLDYPDFFDDSIQLNNLDEFYKLFDEIVKDSVTLKKGEEVVGWIYLDTLDEKFATYNVLLKRRSVSPLDSVPIVTESLRYFFYKHDVKMIGGIIRINNFAAIRGAKQIGAVITEYMPRHEHIKGEPIDCVYAGILREVLV